MRFLILFLLALSLQADHVTYVNDFIPGNSEPWTSGQASFPAFNPSLGVLTSTTLKVKPVITTSGHDGTSTVTMNASIGPLFAETVASPVVITTLGSHESEKTRSASETVAVSGADQYGDGYFYVHLNPVVSYSSGTVSSFVTCVLTVTYDYTPAANEPRHGHH